MAVAMTALMALSGSAFAAGDADKGKAGFAKCLICHQAGLGAKPFVGPELNGIVGRDAASTMYSAGMKRLRDAGFVWTEENIDKRIADPKAMIPDSPMSLAFQGISDANERADIIAYLKTQCSKHFSSIGGNDPHRENAPLEQEQRHEEGHAFSASGNMSASYYCGIRLTRYLALMQDFTAGFPS